MSEGNEIWKDAVGFEGFYEVSSAGRVRRSLRAPGCRSTWRGRVITPDPNASGYLRVSLYAGGKCHREQVHRLVARVFLDGFVPRRQVNHKNGVPTDNRVENLEWVTPRENVAHAWRTGLCRPFKRDEHGQTVLNERSAAAVKFLHHVKEIPQATLAEAYGVSATAISTICREAK